MCSLIFWKSVYMSALHIPICPTSIAGQMRAPKLVCISNGLWNYLLAAYIFKFCHFDQWSHDAKRLILLDKFVIAFGKDAFSLAV